MPRQVIKSWYNDSVLYECEAESVKECLEKAVADRASLVRASLDGARLDGARLDGARLDGASLVRASLDGARLTPIRDDLWAVLCASPHEVLALRAAIVEGRINGSAYEGECACLVGTIANARHCGYGAIPGLAPNSSRPAEVFFLAIKMGDTPETSQFSALAVNWIDDWRSRFIGAFDGQEWPATLPAAVAQPA